MRLDVITIFPHILDSYFNESMLKRARAKKLVDIRIHDLRDYVKVATRGVRLSSAEVQARGNLPPRRQVDDRPYGGGPGMVLKIEPLARALGSILKPKAPPEARLARGGKSLARGEARQGRQKPKVILFSAAGKQFTQKMAQDWSKKYKHIIMIAGHYEGIDERIKKLIYDLGFRIEEISIGPYVLTGGELPAMVVIDAVSRHIPGVLGKEESLEEKRHGVGVPVYTRPEVFIWRGKKYAAPGVLLSGDHEKIKEWRNKNK